MGPSILQRFSWNPPALVPEGGRSEPAVMARAGMYLYGAGATLGLLSLLLPVPSDANRASLVALLASAYAITLLLLIAFDRLPHWAFRGLLAGGTGIVTGAVFASGDATSAYGFFYLLIALYAFYFFDRREAIAQLMLVGAAYGLALAVQRPTEPLTRWLIMIGTLAVAGLLMRQLRERLDGLIDRLADAAKTDALTGLLNRRGFRELLDVELERANRGSRPLSLLLADLDYFKLVNDRFGHDAGDRALREVGLVLSREKRRIDSAARCGGEEFAVILPDTDERSAYVLAERLRTAVERQFADRSVALTISMGIAAFPEHGSTPDDLLRNSDQALYAAKELGRNGSVIFSPRAVAILSGMKLRREGELEARLASVISLSEALDIRDTGSLERSRRIGHYAELLALELGLEDARAQRVGLAGRLRDIGKITVRESVLHKAGSLTPSERRQVRTHPEMSAEILDGRGFDDIREWVLLHHERPDGRGYPVGLPDEKIPLEAKIVAVVEAYEAMTRDRPERGALIPEAARRELFAFAGSQFDAGVVAAFVTVLDREDQRVGALAS